MNPSIHFPTLSALLASHPPSMLFHYTGPSGVLGILDSKTLLAGRAGDMNDSKEQQMGIDIVQNYVMNTLNVRRPDTEEDCAFWEAMSVGVSGTNRQIFTVSLTSEKDSLEQWRAYCPRSGGVAMAFPSEHLQKAAADQGFFLARCSYTHEEQYRLVAEICDHHYAEFQRRCAEGGIDVDSLIADQVQLLAADIAQYSPLIKHGTFRNEKEWRLVSAPRTREKLKFLPSATGIKVYREFHLFTSSAPSPERAVQEREFPSFGYVIGPNVDVHNMSYPLQMAYEQSLGNGNFWMTRTSSTYR